MKKLSILFLLIFLLTGCTGNYGVGIVDSEIELATDIKKVKELPEYLKLKDDYSKIKEVKEIRETKLDENGNTIDLGIVKEYYYNTYEEVKQQEFNGIKEDLAKRTEDSIHFKKENGKYFGKLYTAKEFINEDGKWTRRERATTTIEAFDLQEKVSIGYVKPRIIKYALAADTIYSSAGDGLMVNFNISGGATYTTYVAQSAGNTLVGGVSVSADAASDKNWGIISKNNTYISRVAYVYNTSSIGAGNTVTSAKTYFICYNFYSNNSSLTLHVVPSSRTSTSTLALDDWGRLNKTSWGSSPWSQISGNEQWFYVDWNSTGEAGIDVTGETEVYVITNYDLNETNPASTATDGCAIYYQQYTGTTKDPYLLVEYEATPVSSGGSPKQRSSINQKRR